MPIKNIELFIETLKRLQSCDAEWSARIIGPVGDEKYKNKLDKLIQQNNVRNIVFTGPLTQTQLVKEYQEACIFINTSKTNSMDKTVLESILCGCIPVTANIAFADLLEDTKLLVEDNKSILFFEAVVQATSPESNEVIDILIERIMKSHSLSSFTKRIFQHG